MEVRLKYSTVYGASTFTHWTYYPGSRRNAKILYLNITMVCQQHEPLHFELSEVQSAQYTLVLTVQV